MKKYAKIGNRPNKPAYRTSSSFRGRKFFERIKYRKNRKIIRKNQI